jgi:DNA-binding GntR family transcriptional regulator
MRSRIEIETIALRWSVEKGGVEWEANLLSAFHRLSRQSKIDPQNPDAISEAWSREHADFHAAMVAACGSPTMMAIRERLFEQADRYVALSIMSSGPLRDDVTEHKQLMRATLNRETEKAIELNRLHIIRTLDKVAASFAAGKSATEARAAGRKRAR